MENESSGQGLLRAFVEGAGEVASVQASILNAMESVFSATDYAAIEAAMLAPGYEGWESRAISLIKQRVSENHGELMKRIATLNAKFRASVPYPGQSEEFWVDPLTRPHLRVYWCLRCGFRQSSMALSGICCHGQPKCGRCSHEVHEPTCRRNQPEKEPA